MRTLLLLLARVLLLVYAGWLWTAPRAGRARRRPGRAAHVPRRGRAGGWPAGGVVRVAAVNAGHRGCLVNCCGCGIGDGQQYFPLVRDGQPRMAANPQAERDLNRRGILLALGGWGESHRADDEPLPGRRGTRRLTG